MKRKKVEEMARKRLLAATSKPIINLVYQKGDIYLIAAISENTEKGMASLWTEGVLPVTPHDLQQIGWMLIDFAGRLEDEVTHANEGESKADATLPADDIVRCEHVDSSFGRCVLYWGHTTNEHGYQGEAGIIQI